MDKKPVDIDFEALKLLFGDYIRAKAAKVNGTIAYRKGNLLVAENPKTGELKVLKEFAKPQ